VLCRPPGNKRPPRKAVSACHDRLIEELSQRRPLKVLALGRIAAWALTGKWRQPIEQLRLLRHYLDDGTEVRVTYHPSALTRNPEWERRFDYDVGWLSDD